ncbi:MAG: LysR family transcriptional regulator [Segniliparus sp.]|uniref:LysR family transcriptional regulator n=1 Tax=Segniliparus sp. TaxID=2804064 RepID=UPI003F36A04D
MSATGRRAMDFRRVEHFLVLAQERHFTRAAHRLGLSQQALSASVRQLERDLGVDLVDRSRAPISLTPSGERFLQDMLPIRKSLRAAMRRARADAPEVVTVAHTPAVRSEEVVQLLRPLLAARPEFSLHAVIRFPDEILADVADGILDLGFLRRTLAPALPASISSRVIARHPLRAVVAAAHPLAGRESVALGELARCPMVVWAPPGESAFTDFLLGLFPAGQRPAHRVSRVQGLPPEHTLEFPEEFVLTTGALLGAPGLASVPVLPAPVIDTYAVWRDRCDLVDLMAELSGGAHRVV